MVAKRKAAVKPRYVIRPKADQDLDAHADYLTTEASLNVSHRFLVSAHDTFALLATHPHMVWSFKSQSQPFQSMRVFPVYGFEKMLVLYQPLKGGVEIIRVLHGSRDVLAALGE